MGISRRVWALLFLVLAVAGVLFLSSGMSGMELTTQWNVSLFGSEAGNERSDAQNGRDGLLDRLLVIPPEVLQIMSLLLIVLMPIALFLALISPEVRRAILSELKNVLPFAIMAAAFLFLLRRLQRNLFRPSLPQALDGRPEVPDWIRNPSALVAFIIGVGLLTLLLAAVWYVWRRRQRPTLELIALEAQTTIQELQAGKSFKNAIIACYAAMCEILREHRSVERGQAMTPREFAHNLEEAGLMRGQALRLTRLFEAVRYGDQTPAEEDEAEALACLSAVATVVEPDRQLRASDLFRKSLTISEPSGRILTSGEGLQSEGQEEAN